MKIISLIDNALTASLVVTAFIALAVYSKPYPENKGYTKSERHSMERLVAKAVATPALTYKQASQIVHLYGGK